jgi:hypothetical protein
MNLILRFNLLRDNAFENAVEAMSEFKTLLTKQRSHSFRQWS